MGSGGRDVGGLLLTGKCPFHLVFRRYQWQRSLRFPVRLAKKTSSNMRMPKEGKMLTQICIQSRFRAEYGHEQVYKCKGCSGDVRIEPQHPYSSSYNQPFCQRVERVRWQSRHLESMPEPRLPVPRKNKARRRSAPRGGPSEDGALLLRAPRMHPQGRMVPEGLARPPRQSCAQPAVRLALALCRADEHDAESMV